MKYKLLLLLFFSSFILCRCKKNYRYPPNFEVSTQRSTYSVGDTVNFVIKGNPDFLIFFSGLPGKEYSNGPKLNGIPIKGVDVRLEKYAFIYTLPGEFMATFVGASNNVYFKDEIVKSIKLTIK